ncbi:MAG TPA: class I SAM-dependent methyltransferase [Noviherbaspirillum sp.]|nr:class I SAM-dependent methyltransferase [Noviherbaspirillum sp.]
MTDWTAGYVADVGYTYGYYTELNPLRVKLAFLNAGLVFPEVGNACELGFGQGLSANFHAAASTVKWCGTDFNPAQAAFAQELADAADSGARLYDDAFADFCTRTDLPDFDYIGLHGIWTWISDENRTIIVDFIRRKLKVGGVLYVSYNTLPGWASYVPLRHLLTEHAEVIGSEGHGIVSRVDGALEFATRLLATNPAYARGTPLVDERLKLMRDQNRRYLAHEYFNRDWHPMHFATMAQWLEPAKLSYACSAHYLDHIDQLNLTGEQLSFLKEIPDANFRETVRDFMVNQQFRKDYWVKGARKLSALEQAEVLRDQQVILATHRADVVLKVKGALGDADMNAAVYAPILDVLADHKVKTLGQIEQTLRGNNGLNFGKLLQAIMVLAGAGYLMPVQEEQSVAKVKKSTDKLNKHLMDKARGNGEINYLASPTIGGGVAVGRIAQLFLLAREQGRKTPQDWADYAWQVLASQGQRIQKEGKTLESVEENRAHLGAQAQTFADKQLPLLKALQIA